MSEKNQEPRTDSPEAKKRKVQIEFKQKVTYNVEIEVTEDEYEMLQEYDGEDIPQVIRKTLQPHPVYAFLDGLNNDDNFYDADNEFEDFEITDLD